MSANSSRDPPSILEPKLRLRAQGYSKSMSSSLLYWLPGPTSSDFLSSFLPCMQGAGTRSGKTISAPQTPSKRKNEN